MEKLILKLGPISLVPLAVIIILLYILFFGIKTLLWDNWLVKNWMEAKSICRLKMEKENNVFSKE